MTAQPPSVGYIGLGNMGGPLACRLAANGGLLVHDLSPSAVQAVVARGGTAADSAADLAQRSDLVLMCLPTTDHVQDLLFGTGGIAASARRSPSCF